MTGAVQQRRSGKDHRGRAQVPQQVIREQRNVVADLVQFHELVLHGAVVELEGTCPQQDSPRPPGRDQDGPPPKIGEEEQSGYHGKPAEGVEQAIRKEPDGGGGLVVKMVPLQQLVKNDLVDECGNANTNQHSGEDIAAAGTDRSSGGSAHPVKISPAGGAVPNWGTVFTGVSGLRCDTMGAMWMGIIEFDLLLGDVHSLKEKRSVIRPILAEVRRRFEVSAAETGELDLHRRAELGVGLVAANGARIAEVLDAVERLVAARPEVELLSARRRMFSSEDW